MRNLAKNLKAFNEHKKGAKINSFLLIDLQCAENAIESFKKSNNIKSKNCNFESFIYFLEHNFIYFGRSYYYKFIAPANKNCIFGALILFFNIAPYNIYKKQYAQFNKELQEGSK